MTFAQNFQRKHNIPSVGNLPQTELKGYTQEMERLKIVIKGSGGGTSRFHAPVYRKRGKISRADLNEDRGKAMKAAKKGLHPA